MDIKTCTNCGCDKKEHGNSYCVVCGWSRCRKFKSTQNKININKKNWNKLMENEDE